jgi:hypothetical protein
VNEIENNPLIPHQRISKVDFTAFSGYMPVLPYLLYIFYSSSREIWSIEG